MRPRFVLPSPQPAGPVIDGLDLREFLLRVPPDGAPGITVRWVWTVAGEAFGEQESMALAVDEMGDVAGLETALVTWLHAVLAAKKKLPADATAERSTVRRAAPAPAEMPMGTLG